MKSMISSVDRVVIVLLFDVELINGGFVGIGDSFEAGRIQRWPYMDNDTILTLIGPDVHGVSVGYINEIAEWD